jgi:N-carbamoylputrescine amidase
MLLAAIQFKTRGVKDIREKGLSMIEKALKRKPDFILLHELFNTIYFPQYRAEEYFRLAEEIPGETTEKIASLIRGTGATVIASIFEREDKNHYLSAAVVDPDIGVIGTYRKLHIPTIPGIYETYYFKPGDKGHVVFRAQKANISIMLCYDRHFPESARIYGLKGADILFVSAATPKSARHIWYIEMQAHAFSNLYYLVCANRCGTEGGIDFLGRSFICDYRGKIMEEASEDKDEIIYAEVDIDEARKARLESAFYRDRHPELYREVAAQG